MNHDNIHPDVRRFAIKYDADRVRVPHRSRSALHATVEGVEGIINQADVPGRSFNIVASPSYGASIQIFRD